MEERLAERAEKERKNGHVKRIKMRMTTRRSSTALESWCENVKELKELRSKSIKVMRWKKKFAATWVKVWYAHMIEEKQMRAKARMVVQLVMNHLSAFSTRTRVLARVLEKWQNQACKLKQLRVEANLAQLRLMHRALIHRDHTHAFDTWSHKIAVKKARRLKMFKAFNSKVHSVLFASFERWHAKIVDSEDRLLFVLRALGASCRRFLARRVVSR